MTAYLKWLLPIIIVGGGAAGAWYFFSQPTPPAVTQTADVSTTASSSARSIQYPLPATDNAASVPALDDSDAPVLASLQELFGTDVTAWLLPTQLIRHVVTTVDNLPREHLAVQMRPTRSTPGQFLINGPDDNATIADSNYARYQPALALLQKIDMTLLASWYKQHYRLFQQAYESLGYPQGYFNDRLVAVIDHLLQTPEPTTPLRLTHTSVMYRFADPSLEARSSGQKTLLRMGPDNARLVKGKLRELRAAITSPQN